MRESLTGNYYDLLSYFGSGNYGKLTRCFHSVLQHSDIHLKINDVAKFRRKSLIFMNAVGLIEIDSENNYEWASCAGAIVSLTTSKLLCVGGSNLINNFTDLLSGEDVSLNDVGYQYQNVFSEIDFLPRFPVVSMPAIYGKSLADKLNCRFVSFPAINVIEKLHTLNEIARSLVDKIGYFSVDGSCEQFEFNDEHSKWEFRNVDEISYPSFIRTAKISGGYNYFIIRRKGTQLHYFRIENQDWSYFIAHHLLNIEIKCRYCAVTKIFSYPRSIRMPTLIKRFLTLSSFSDPGRKDKYFYEYKDCCPITIDKLKKKIPILKF